VDNLLFCIGNFHAIFNFSNGNVWINHVQLLVVIVKILLLYAVFRFHRLFIKHD
jgi:hypothetical protein